VFKFISGHNAKGSRNENGVQLLAEALKIKGKAKHQPYIFVVCAHAFNGGWILPHSYFIHQMLHNVLPSYKAVLFL
jgi:hypothetical protein